MGSTWGVKCYEVLDIGPTRSDLRVFASKVLQTCLAVPTVGSFRNKFMQKNMLFFLWEGLTIVELFEGLWSVGTRFLH